MANRKQEILDYLLAQNREMSASEVAESMQADRANISRYLNELHKNGAVQKSNGRPVLYKALNKNADSSVKPTFVKTKMALKEEKQNSVRKVNFDSLIGSNGSLKVMIQQAKAAILYPPRGLHTIIFGQTGTGKSLFAECMYQFALDAKMVESQAPFISFNCADYAQNPQLLFGHIFGVKKGAYTGAGEDRPGLVAKADGGILFLDEIHRLPPEGQEMLFTFIDKGFYRPLGESSSTYEASVQIIGATTETSDAFLSTFNRRIPMAITLPPLSERSIEERYEMVKRFFTLECRRLEQKIVAERDVVLAFMLYDPEANIGQVQRDLKLVCAKAFLHFRTHEEDYLHIETKDLPLLVQKGLLKIKQYGKQLDRLVDNKNPYMVFEDNTTETIWENDISGDRSVYDTIDQKVKELSKQNLETLDLEQLIASDDAEYFEDYVEQLAREDIHKDLIPDTIWLLTNQLYDLAQKRLDRLYNEKARFAFGLHLMSTVDRIKKKKNIVHPDLNNVRKSYSKEFQVAIEMSGMIEEQLNIEIPLDEIGFITMFLSLDLNDQTKTPETQVGVIVLMHGNSTASSMLETVQELLGTKQGVAIDMPLTMDVSTTYEKVRDYVLEQQDNFKNGLLLLTDMGSLTNFATMINEETMITTRAISMTSTLMVLESLRMAVAGRSLDDVYQNAQLALETSVKEQFWSNRPRKKAVIVTCFTGEGVAAQLYKRVSPIFNPVNVEVIQMQFLQKEAFKHHVDELMGDYDIRAIVGTVDIEYQKIPFFSAMDIFDDDNLQVLKRIVSDDVPIENMIHSLEGTINTVPSLKELIHTLQMAVEQIQSNIHIIVDPEIDTGIIIHLAFMIDSLIQGHESRHFENLLDFKSQYQWEMETTKAALIMIEKLYKIDISESEIAFLVQMFTENQIKR